jgi:hypothetical protein
MKNEEINSEIREHWLSFSMLPGSHAIASHSALNAIFALSVIRPPKIVLEIGVGLGTITNFLLSFTNAQVVGIEHSKFLRDSFINVNAARLMVFADESDLIQYEYFFDWIIADGPFDKSKLKLAMLNPNLQCIVVENQRIGSRLFFAHQLSKMRYRYSYMELDSYSQTGIAAFLIQSEIVSPRSLMGQALDLLSFYVKVLPRYLKLVIRSRGKILRVGKLFENESGVV